jgi:hypothetical protein
LVFPALEHYSPVDLRSGVYCGVNGYLGRSLDRPSRAGTCWEVRREGEGEVEGEASADNGRQPRGHYAYKEGRLESADKAYERSIPIRSTSTKRREDQDGVCGVRRAVGRRLDESVENGAVREVEREVGREMKRQRGQGQGALSCRASPGAPSRGCVVVRPGAS